MNEPIPPQGAQTALRAVSILESFTLENPSLSLSEVSEAVGLAPSTVHRLLRALQSRDLVVVNEASKKYVLGVGVMRLARSILNKNGLTLLARPGMERLRTATSETVSLQIVLGERRVAIAELVSPHAIQMSSGIGEPYPIHLGSAGKSMLAFFPAKKRFRFVTASADPAALQLDLEGVRKRGYAVSAGEVVSGAAAIAAPVFDAEGAVFACINVTGPAERFSTDLVQETAKELLAVTTALSADLAAGASSNP